MGSFVVDMLGVLNIGEVLREARRSADDCRLPQNIYRFFHFTAISLYHILHGKIGLHVCEQVVKC